MGLGKLKLLMLYGAAFPEHSTINDIILEAHE